MRVVALICAFVAGLFGWVSFGRAEMNSANYMIRWDSIGSGGGDTAASASFLLRDTVGNLGVGAGASETYFLQSGYRAGVLDQFVSFDVFAQVSASAVAATARTGETVTVASAAGFGVGDYLALVQDRGASQVSAVGRIVSIVGNQVTVDQFADNGTSPVIDGTNDYAYRLAGVAANLGTLSTSEVATALIGFEVTADVDGGYTVFVAEDGGLRSGPEEINKVSDGAVTAGSEEYGGQSSDTAVTGSTFGTQDTAFTMVLQPIVEYGSNAFQRRDFLTLKAAISSSTPNATYSHVLSMIFVPNF